MVKIKEIRAFEVDLTPRVSGASSTLPREPSRARQIEMNRPISRYPQVAARGRAARPRSAGRPACMVIAEDGTWGFGISLFAGPVISLIR